LAVAVASDVALGGGGVVAVLAVEVAVALFSALASASNFLKALLTEEIKQFE